MKVAIIGANGNIGTRLGELLAKQGDVAVGYIRKEEQAHDLEELGMKTEIADLIKTDVISSTRTVKSNPQFSTLQTLRITL